jgi:hypothetical protein
MYSQCYQQKLALLGESDDSTLLTLHSLALLEMKGATPLFLCFAG